MFLWIKNIEMNIEPTKEITQISDKLKICFGISYISSNYLSHFLTN